jgi:hypothetical protein
VLPNSVLKWSKLPLIFHFFSYFKLHSSYLCTDKILCSQHGWLCGGCSCGSPGDIMNYMFYCLYHTGRSASQQDKDYISWNTLHHHITTTVQSAIKHILATGTQIPLRATKSLQIKLTFLYKGHCFISRWRTTQTPKVWNPSA